MVSHCLRTHDFGGGGPSRLYSAAPPTDGGGGRFGAMRSELNDFSAARPWTIVEGRAEPALTAALPAPSEEGPGPGGGGGGGGSALLQPEAMAAVLGEQAAHAQALPHAVAQLVAMGFCEDDVKAALGASGNLPQQALELLLQ